MTPLLNIKSISMLLWALANTALVGKIGAELEWGDKIVPPLPSPVVHLAAPTELTLLPNFRLPPPGEKYRDTLARPLFVPSRREAPPIPPPPPPPKPTMQKGQFQLLGTLLEANHTYAMLREVNGGKQRRVTEGERVHGILVSSIGPERVVLTQYEEEEVLAIKVMPSPKAPPPSTALGKPATPQTGQSGAASAKLMPAPASQRAAARGRNEDSQQKHQRRPSLTNQGMASPSPSAEGSERSPAAPPTADGTATPTGGDVPPK